MLGASRWSRVTACLDRRSRQGKGNWLQEGSRRTRTGGGGRSIVRGCLRKSKWLLDISVAQLLCSKNLP